MKSCLNLWIIPTQRFIVSPVSLLRRFIYSLPQPPLGTRTKNGAKHLAKVGCSIANSCFYQHLHAHTSSVIIIEPQTLVLNKYRSKYRHGEDGTIFPTQLSIFGTAPRNSWAQPCFNGSLPQNTAERHFRAISPWLESRVCQLFALSV